MIDSLNLKGGHVSGVFSLFVTFEILFVFINSFECIVFVVIDRLID